MQSEKYKTATANDKLMSDDEKEYYSLIKSVFDILAPFYDIVTTPISTIRDKVVSFTDARKGSKILDVATGTGKQAFAFGKMGYDVTGIDLSDAMLKVANKKNKYDNVKFEVADATNLRFANDSFDVSCISFALHDMPLNIGRKVLKEMIRVTKAKGTIVIIDYALPKNKIGRFLAYNITKLYEGKYYTEFIKSGFEALLGESRITIKEGLSVLLGTGRILKGVNVKSPSHKDVCILS